MCHPTGAGPAVCFQLAQTTTILWRARRKALRRAGNLINHYQWYRCVCVCGWWLGRTAGWVGGSGSFSERVAKLYVNDRTPPSFSGRPGSKLAHYAVAVVEDRKLIIILRNRINPGTENPVQGEWDEGIYPPIAMPTSLRSLTEQV